MGQVRKQRIRPLHPAHPGLDDAHVVETVPHRLQIRGQERPLAQIHPRFQVAEPVHRPAFVVAAHRQPLRRGQDLVVLGTFQCRPAAGHLLASADHDAPPQALPSCQRVPADRLHTNLHRRVQVVVKVPHRALENRRAAVVPDQLPTPLRQRQFSGFCPGIGIPLRRMYGAP